MKGKEITHLALKKREEEKGEKTTVRKKGRRTP